MDEDYSFYEDTTPDYEVWEMDQLMNDREGYDYEDYPEDYEPNPYDGTYSEE